MDDEVFGCGGALRISSLQGTEVHPIYLTDGSKGIDRPIEPGPSAIRQRIELIATRKEESRRAAKILGLAEPTYLDLPDGMLSADERSVALLSAALERLRPELIYLPFLGDAHPDHRAAHGLFIRAAKRAGLDRSTPCWSYEVWSPCPANTAVDISDVMDSKRAAMREFHSQISKFDYPSATEGLNRYRSLWTRDGHGFAEAFHVTSLARCAQLRLCSGEICP